MLLLTKSEKETHKDVFAQSPQPSAPLAFSKFAALVLMGAVFFSLISIWMQSHSLPWEMKLVWTKFYSFYIKLKPTAVLDLIHMKEEMVSSFQGTLTLLQTQLHCSLYSHCCFFLAL